MAPCQSSKMRLEKCMNQGDLFSDLPYFDQMLLTTFFLRFPNKAYVIQSSSKMTLTEDSNNTDLFIQRYTLL